MFKRENRDEVVRLRVTTEEKEILKKFAQEKDLTMSAVIAQALDNYLDATTPKDFEQMEVYYNGKKDKALTRKVQNALAFLNAMMKSWAIRLLCLIWKKNIKNIILRD